MLEIGNKGVASVLQRLPEGTAGELRDNVKYQSLQVKEDLSADDYKIMDIIEKKRDIKIKKQEIEDKDARIILGVIRSLCGNDPINIVDMHNKDTSITPLQRVKNIFKSFEQEYKGSTFLARKEFNLKMDAILEAKKLNDLPRVVQQIEDIRIRVQNLYPVNLLDPEAVRGYSDGGCKGHVVN